MDLLGDLPEQLVPVAYLVPAVIAFYVGHQLRKRARGRSPGGRPLGMLYYLCLAEGIHNSYYFVATALRPVAPQLYERMMQPLAWLLAQGIIAVTFVYVGLYYFRQRHVELGDVRAVRQDVDRFRELASMDPLTGLHNRRSLTELLEAEVRRAGRMGRPLTLLMLDLDGFKGYNDSRGHREGDHLLVAVAEQIRAGLRQGIDRAFRYGGDEFFIVLPEAGEAEARQIAERLRLSVREIGEGAVTLSVGLFEVLPQIPATLDELIACADEAMYTAKRRGGDRVCSCAEEHGVAC